MLRLLNNFFLTDTCFRLMPIDYTFDQMAKHIRNPEYAFPLPSIVGAFRLPNINLHLTMYEDIIIGSLKPRESKLNQEKSGHWTLRVPIHLYYNNKEKLVVPEPYDFFITVRHEIEQAIQTIHAK